LDREVFGFHPSKLPSTEPLFLSSVHRTHKFFNDRQLFWLRDIKGKYCDGIPSGGPSPRVSRISDEELYDRQQKKLRAQSSQIRERELAGEFDDDDIPF